MKNFLLSAILLLLVSTQFSHAQLDSAKAKSLLEREMMAPVMVVEDIKYVLNQLSTLELETNEVKPFLDCKSSLQYILDAAEKSGAEDTDPVQAEIPIIVAQNILNLLSRTKIKANDAEKFQRFQDAIVASNDELMKYLPQPADTTGGG
jgi:hypothetical protein